MNKDKIIKDLKEQNRKLKNQYELQEARLHNLQYKADKLKEVLEITQEKWQKDKQFYKHRFEDYIEYKNRIDKALEYIGLNEEDLKLYDIFDVNGIELFKILRGEDSE